MVVKKMEGPHSDKRTESKENVSKSQLVEILMAKGIFYLSIIRQISIIEQTYFHWKKKY